MYKLAKVPVSCRENCIFFLISHSEYVRLANTLTLTHEGLFSYQMCDAFEVINVLSVEIWTMNIIHPKLNKKCSFATGRLVVRSGTLEWQPYLVLFMWNKCFLIKFLKVEIGWNNIWKKETIITILKRIPNILKANKISIFISCF